jgi:hypothetical protein
MRYLNRSLSTVAMAALFGPLLPLCCCAGDAVFSNDGQRIYVTTSTPTGPALREIDLDAQTVRVIPLPQLAKNEYVAGITRSPWDKLAVITRNTIWVFDPRSGSLSKIRDLGKNGNFFRVAYNPKMQEIFVTTNEGLFVLKNGRELVPVFVRRHQGVGCPIFTSSGDIYYSYEGDLWHGQIEVAEGRYSLNADRYAPIAAPETANTTPNETGVVDIAVSRDTIYVHLARMGGSGWGWLAQLARPLAESKFSMEPGQGITIYKAALDSAKVLLDNARPLSLCASPDETHVYYCRHTETDQDEDWLITNGQSQQMHLRSQ